MIVLEVEKPGLLSTVQDLGRRAYQEFGMPVAGAVDEYALQVANILVGNAPSEAALELTLAGPVLKVLKGGLIAITGADLDPKLNGQQLPMWEAVKVSAGDTIALAWARSGCRSYLALAGGIDVPSVMGSKSTYIRGEIGGIGGRALKSGDLIRSGESPETLEHFRLRVPAGYIPHYDPFWEVRVVPGPQDDYFTERGLHTFFNNEYRVTGESDRMGCRLEGPKIEHLAGADIISDGIPPGAVQVPGDGRPIVMLADRQTTGGYAKIATVISADLWKIAQAKPGDRLRFQAVPVEEAQRIYFNYKRCLISLPELLQLNDPPKCYRVTVGGRVFEAEVWETQKN